MQILNKVPQVLGSNGRPSMFGSPNICVEQYVALHLVGPVVFSLRLVN